MTATARATTNGNVQANEFLYRRAELEDVSKPFARHRKGPFIGFAIIISATTRFNSTT